MSDQIKNVRNFWIELECDGPKGKRSQGTGPVGKDGGFQLHVTMRDGPGVTTVLQVTGTALADGFLALTVYDPGKGRPLHKVFTKR